MAVINPYLNFSGNAEEAFLFYRSVFGGRFMNLLRYRDMSADVPGYERIPEAEKEKIMHISLPIGKENVLMATDMLESMGQPLIPGNNFHIYVDTESEEEAERLFESLSEGGEVEMPLGKVFWGTLFGMVIDPFGIRWMISYLERE